MPFFQCHRGPVAEIALEEDGVFSLDDARGRTWLGYEVKLAEGGEGLKGLLEIMQRTPPTWEALDRAERLGLTGESGEHEVRVVNCESWELRDRLAEPVAGP